MVAAQPRPTNIYPCLGEPATAAFVMLQEKVKQIAAVAVVMSLSVLKWLCKQKSTKSNIDKETINISQSVCMLQIFSFGDACLRMNYIHN